MADKEIVDRMEARLLEEGMGFERGAGGFRIECDWVKVPADVLLVNGEFGWQLAAGGFICVPEEAITEAFAICNEFNRWFYNIKFYIDEELNLVVAFDGCIALEDDALKVKDAVEMVAGGANALWESMSSGSWQPCWNASASMR